ncbi:precorrin-3B C(17)-methyltransferase [Desulfitibacter alkalitolerans]|uniref:precorrin-3B C(17)-methyltransferase n=1 Tax=Desulfitibacter alkalitolerans TaxID=264641 RepID=UPI000483A621
MVVGLGPGNRDLLAPAALEALKISDVIIGYKTYLDLIEDLTEGKEVISSGMRKEIDRAQLAVDLAQQGRTVSVISSGDPGVYGMAGIVLELAGDSVDVEVVPGVTAATAAAAALGAPLMHDFAVISLSDLLTPWVKIMNRLEAAGLGDFIVVLYNPKSHGRQTHIESAREILLWHKNPETPVGIVRCAKRGLESVVITTLRDMLKEEIDMLTTVIVGNSQTKVENGKMVTPRGYKV